MNRNKKLLYNGASSVFCQIITIICGFILPRLILSHYGSAVNGLVNSITYYLGFISLCECGVGGVVNASLYKPLASGDTKKVSQIMTSAALFFRKIAAILIAYVVVLCFVFPLLINQQYSFIYIALLILAISINLLVQYNFGIVYKLLISADQKEYITVLLQCAALVGNTIISAVLIRMDASIQVVKFFSAIIYIIPPIIIKMYVNKKYIINFKEEYKEEPIAQKWNGLSQHIASIVLNNTDVMVLTVFSTLENVSVYGVYDLVMRGIKQFVTAAFTGINSYFGNMIANGENDTLNRNFSRVEFVTHSLVVVLFTVAFIMLSPFVLIYTEGIKDVSYVNYQFAMIIVMAQAMYCIRIPYSTIVFSAGHYKQTQNSAIIEALLNVSISILVVTKMGLVGVAIGTFIAMAYRTLYFVWYLSCNILHRNIRIFAKRFATDILMSVCIIFAIRVANIDCSASGYFVWMYKACIVTVIALMICIIVNLLLYRKEMVDIAFIFTNRLKKS